MNVTLFIWLIQVPYKRRREMERLDREYSEKKRTLSLSNQSGCGSKQALVIRRSSSSFDPLPNLKIPRSIRHSDGMIIIPNSSTFVSIPEVSNENTRKTMDIVEFREQDDKY